MFLIHFPSSTPPPAPGVAVGRWCHRDVGEEPGYSERGGLWEERGGLQGEFLFDLIWGEWWGSQSSPQAVQWGRGRGRLLELKVVWCHHLSLAHTSLALSHTDTHLSSLLLRPDDRDKDRRVNSSGAVCPHCSLMSISLKSLRLFLHTSSIWEKKEGVSGRNRTFSHTHHAYRPFSYCFMSIWRSRTSDRLTAFIKYQKILKTVRGGLFYSSRSSLV